MSVTNISEENIVWSGKDFKLSEFVEIYPPPQIVKVEEGYMDDTEEERTLSSSQLLTLHIVKDLVTVSAFDKQNLKISLPTNSSAIVEIICQPSHYENVEELVRDLPPFVASVEKHPWLEIDENDVLEIKGVAKSFRSNHLKCVNRTSGGNVELPLNYTARFKALGGCPIIKPTMADITKYCKFPINVRFIDCKLKVIREGFNAGFPFGLNALGPLTLKSVLVNQVIFTTPWGHDRVIPLPLNLEIRVVAALGALQNDHNYSKLCKIAHSNTKTDDLDLKFIKEGEYRVLLEEKQPQPKESEDDDDAGAYCDVGPPVPSREFKPSRRGVTRSESSKDSPARQKDKTKKISRSLSLNIVEYEDMEGVSNPDEVFGDNFEPNDNDAKSRFTPVKKVFKAIKKVVGPKLSIRKRDDGDHYDEVTPGDLGYAATSGHALPEQRNLDPSLYKEIQPLPSNLQADRYNEQFVTESMKDSSFSRCKIRNPNDIRTWTIEEVSECLRYCRLEEYVNRFKEELIDGCLLADLDEGSLRSLGVDDKLHIKKMMKIINEGWMPKH